jgi:hypothetical protein
MFEDLTKAISEFKKAKSVGIFTSSIKTIDKATSIIALAKICEKEGKSFKIICPDDLKDILKNLFDSQAVEILKENVSKDYIVSIDYSSANIDKVLCKKDEEDKKLNFVITPKDNLFSFDSVELISGVGSFDLIFSLGLGNHNSVSEEMFAKSTIISITRKETKIGTYNFLINGKKSYSEIIYEFAKAFSSSIDEDLLNILLQGIIAKYKLLENGDNDGWVLVEKFLKYGADFNKAFRELNYSKDHANLELQRKVMENLRVDKDSKVLWSKVAFVSNIDSKNIDLSGRIIFNISKDFDLAFVFYKIDSKNAKVVLESNDVEKFSAIALKKELTGSGNSARAVYSSGKMDADEFEKRFFEALKTILGLEVF